MYATAQKSWRRYRSSQLSGIEHCKDGQMWYPSYRGDRMQEQRERWMQLCEQAATEQDPEKLMALIAEINRLLEAKERRLRHHTSDSNSAG